MNDRSSWNKGFLLAVLVLVGGGYAHRLYLEHKVQAAQAEWSSTITEAASTDRQGLAVQILRAFANVSADQSLEEKKRRERDAIRVEAQRSHIQYQEYLNQSAYEKAEAVRLVKQAKLREEQEAIARSKNEIAAFKRALAIPLPQN